MDTVTVETKMVQSYRTKPENVEKVNQINDLIFATLRETPNPEAGIQQAMKLLASMNVDLLRVTQRLQERQYEERQACCELISLECIEKNFRWMRTDIEKKLASLKREVDKVTSANNAYKEKINIHNLYFQMHHGTNNIAKERKLMKENINGRQSKEDHSDSGLSTVGEINYRISDLQLRTHRLYIHNMANPLTRVDAKQILKDIVEIKRAKDKAFANDAVKGKNWNSLATKNAIKRQIKVMEMAFSDEERKKHLQLRAQIHELRQIIKAAKKDIKCLKKQQLGVNRKKGQAYNVILNLIKTQDQAM